MVPEPEVTGVPPDGRVPGLTEAIERYGTPAIRTYHYDVSQDTWHYWQTVRRRRAAEVVVLLRRRNGRYLVHTKRFYPEGTYRLPSGGIKPGEDLVEALRREMAEETSLAVCVEAFLAIVAHRFHRRGEEITFTSYLFLLREVSGTLHTADEGEEITGFRELPLAEVVALADELEALSPDWHDWGRFRASVHRVVGEVMDEE
jgi:ADP-ribose pyrophosphatase YjhB (NUDIX family)